LILALSGRQTLTNRLVAEYRAVLEDPRAVGAVEVIVATGANGRTGADAGSVTGDAALHARYIRAASDEWSALAREGLAASTGDHLIVLDVDRHYSSESIRRVIEPVQSGSSELAVAVPASRRAGLARWWHSRPGMGLVSRLFLGSADVFSGLFAVHRSVWEAEGRSLAGIDSSLVLELLLRRPARCVDVPVPIDGPFRSQRLSLKDLRPLKHVLDGRFGNYSRLVQFCIVGASGMVVDLTFYALFQWLLAFTWLASLKSRLFGFSWLLAIAGSLSIAIALAWNFSLNRRLTFNDAKKGAWLRQFATYALSNALAILVSLSFRVYLPSRVAFFDRHRLAAAVVGIVVATGISFSMSRWVVFARRTAPDRRPTPRMSQGSTVL
jgi:dolichol-phosphate mannosyltransferase